MKVTKVRVSYLHGIEIYRTEEPKAVLDAAFKESGGVGIVTFVDVESGHRVFVTMANTQNIRTAEEFDASRS